MWHCSLGCGMMPAAPNTELSLSTQNKDGDYISMNTAVGKNAANIK